jgi:hypothetical protein
MGIPADEVPAANEPRHFDLADATGSHGGPGCFGGRSGLPGLESIFLKTGHERSGKRSSDGSFQKAPAGGVAFLHGSHSKPAQMRVEPELRRKN